MELQKAICPNCGASITNIQNCEFCGSLLIRLQQSGINVAASDYKDDKKVFQGLIGALKRNLDLQKATNYTIPVATDIGIEENGQTRPLGSVLMQLRAEDDALFFPTKFNDGKEHLMIAFSFVPDTISGDELRLRKFRNLDIYELFIEHISFSEGIKFYEYAIDFGGDAEGAARLISKKIHEVDSIPYEAKIECYTNSGDDIDKSRAILWGKDIADGDQKPWYQTWWGYTILSVGGALIYIIIKSLE
jgi:hypothetical protein